LNCPLSTNRKKYADEVNRKTAATDPRTCFFEDDIFSKRHLLFFSNYAAILNSYDSDLNRGFTVPVPVTVSYIYIYIYIYNSRRHGLASESATATTQLS
jgi:hypothetical protein